VEVIDDFAGEAQTIGTFLEGRFLGELNMLTAQAMYLTAVVREGGEVLAIPREKLKEVVTEEPNLSDIILKAFLARRAYMMRTGLGLRIISSRHSSGAPEGDRGPQQAAPLLDRARGGPQGRRSLAREIRCEAIGYARDHLAGQRGAEEPHKRRVCANHWPQGGRSLRTNLRPRGGRRRACGPRRFGLGGL
jgi:CRP-like cAMP-binding protein